MKSFTEYLSEANYTRFLKKNKSLTDTQRKEINDFYSKINPQAGSKIDWQGKIIRTASYDAFQMHMMKYKSGRKSQKKMKCQRSLRGLTEDQDYVHVRMKTKNYCAYIPLNHDTAQVFNSDKVIGTCKGDWCIGHSSSKDYWSSYVLRENQVPIYVVDQDSKWVVMIQEGNRRYEIWDLANDVPKASIPDFNVKKELLTSGLTSMYDEIREDIYSHDEGSMKEIDEERKQLFEDIKDNAETVIENYNDYEEKMSEYIDDLIDFWKAKKEDSETILNTFRKRLMDVDVAINDTSNDFDTAKFENQLYTRVELRIFKDKFEDAVELAKENYDEFDWNESIRQIEEIKKDGIPLSEDDHDQLIEDLEEFELKSFGMVNMNDWEDVYDENYHKISTDSYRGSDYDTYFNYSYENYGGNAGAFIEEVNEFIKEAHIEPKGSVYKKRTGSIDNEEIYQIFENNSMY